MSLLGLDVGTTGCKAIVVNVEGKLLGESYREYPLYHPGPGLSELDPREVWENVQTVIAEAAHQAGDADPVKAIGISCQGEAGVPLDENGEILYNSPVSFDARTVPQTEWWRREMGAKRIFQITGQPLHPMHTISKIMWLYENVPGLRERMKHFRCFEDFVMEQLGAEPAMSYALAARTMCFDIINKCWSEEICSKAGVDPAVFSPPLPSGEVVGEVSPKMAERLGLRPGVKVATGAHDQPAGAFGAGVIHPNIAVDGTGTVECITPAFSEPVLTDDMLENSFCCYPHAARDLYVTLAFNFTGGALLRWFRDTFGQPEVEEAKRTGRDPYELLIANASPDPVDVYVLPHFTSTGTPYFDSHSKGVIMGLTLSTTRGEIIKACLDGVTFEMRMNLELLEKAGVHIEELRAIGGGARSAFWLQLKADIFGKPIISLDVTEAPCLGAAMLAGRAIGEYSSDEEAVAAAIHERERYEPDEKRHEIYTEKFQIYKEIYPTVVELSHRIPTH